MVNFNELCELMTHRYKIDYILIDQEYKIQNFSDGVHRFFMEETPLSLNADIRETMYELIGYEEIIAQIPSSKEKAFFVSTINKNAYYIDLYLRYMEQSDNIVILIDDVSVQAKKELLILQDRHEKELLLRELAHKNYLLNKYRKASQEAMPMMHLSASCQIDEISINFLKLLNYSRSSIIYQNFALIVDQNETFDKQAILNDMYNHKVHHSTLKLITKSKSMLYVNATFIPMFDEQDQMLKEILLFADDITAHKNDNCQLQEIAYYDNLTGVLNRLGLNKKIDTLLESQKVFSLLFLDLDFFKSVNDTYGHYYGDQILQQVCKRLGMIMQESDLIARYGGDEFILIKNDQSSQTEISKLAQTIIERISQEYKVEDKVITIGVSIGIAHYPQDALSKKELIEKADKAMYYSKDQGRNQLSFYQ